MPKGCALKRFEFNCEDEQVEAISSTNGPSTNYTIMSALGWAIIMAFNGGYWFFIKGMSATYPNLSSPCTYKI